MGQRTFILLKKVYKDRATITLTHHQWGYGKVMPSLFLQELLRQNYPLDRKRYDRVYESQHIDRVPVEPIDIDFTFKPLNSEGNNYLTNEVVDKDLDVFSIPVIQQYGDMTDNNNGGMIVEVSQVYDDKGKPLCYGDNIQVKVSFVLGSEEINYYHNSMNGRITVEEEFGRLVSVEEYIQRTNSGVGEDLKSWDKEFIRSFNTLCNLCGVEQIYNKSEATKVKKRIKHIKQIVEGLTLENNRVIEVPKELQEKIKIFS